MEVGSSNSSGQLSGLVVDTRRKHREELEQLEKMDNGISLLQRIKNKLLHHLLSSSLDVLRFLNNVDSKPDPLLPQTTGAVNSTWDQWFERPKEAKRCGCFIL
ncbi:hypothetical protein IGI04_003044 [Brassica rapa subsp. trilocularis]|uniref:G protein gamma domain-containing protein n=1 Tax=Brassica rapa subsp. trilocularis TaxID=1813537 RepID=A0ABQ7NXA7_BRACM|nr:hypothetical protein IGI04_003044 [Brassica rapa subsp. trilocularis]